MTKASHHKRRGLLRGIFAAILMSVSACAGSMTPTFMRPTSVRDWSHTLEHAKTLAADGKVLQADSALARYASTYPGTPEASESYYWRALLLVQAGAAPAPGPASMLATYLRQPNIDHRIEAEALYRSAAAVDSLTRAASILATKATVATVEAASAVTRVADAKADARAATAETRDQDAEIKRLKDELAKSKEELERIKKRLAEPTKKPPLE